MLKLGGLSVFGGKNDIGCPKKNCDFVSPLTSKEKNVLEVGRAEATRDELRTDQASGGSGSSSSSSSSWMYFATEAGALSPRRVSRNQQPTT
ncbi:hypothetical protein CHARACLAT_017128 [Characodon lateralis]|uniref:Uncharacterized protein n=1 Tax=Characodon lateralis TaxID=208331 RepID=A0ABU7CYG8_9TELE|nr:hypothetical protein [Characodon lateralis]